MFEKLGKAFSKAAKSFSEKELKEKDIEDVLHELEISLLESDVAMEVIDDIKSDLKTKLVGSTVNKKEIEDFVKKSLIESISGMFDEAGMVDMLSNIKSKTDLQDPCIILFVGINGTGKTTTIAKIANLLQKNKISVVVAAADTFRAGAIEQLREHINRLNLKLIAQNYGSDPAAVAHDAVLYAKSHKVDCVLIDSAGRMQTNKNLMEQIAKISKVVSPDLKIFVGDSLAGNDAVSQAREFHKHTTFDGAILTKSDADARGGAALSIVAVTKKPVIYVGTGQGYDDLELFSKEIFLETVFGKPEPEPVPEPAAEPEPEPELESESKIETESTDIAEMPPTAPVVSEEQQNITKKRTNMLFWLRFCFALGGGVIATFLFEGIEDSEEHRWSSFIFMIVLFIITCFIAKGMKINFPKADRKKLVTTGMGSFIFLYLFAWIMTYTLLNLPRDDFSLPFT